MLKELLEKNYVSILLMLDNNLSLLNAVARDWSYSGFQSFLCWIIIYHFNGIYRKLSPFCVSILLMLDNNLSLGSTESANDTGFSVSILLMLDNNLSPFMSGKYMPSLIGFNPSYAG